MSIKAKFRNLQGDVLHKILKSKTKLRNETM